MKKLLVLLAFASIGSLQAMAAGTIGFQNDTVASAFFTNGTTFGKVGIGAGTMMYGLFYSDATLGGTSNNLTLATAVGNSTLSYGVFQGSINTSLPGTSPGDQAWIMVLAWDGALGANGYSHYIGPYGSGPAGAAGSQWDGTGRWFLQTRTLLVTLASDTGPGTTMFQNPGNASHIGGAADLTIFPVPEPTSLVLLLSGVASACIFRRRKL